MTHSRTQHLSPKAYAALSIGAIGVVYGDIGTSPLYALKEAFTHLAGCEPVLYFEFAWKSQGGGVNIFDARPANFLSILGNPVPFDLIPMRL